MHISRRKFLIVTILFALIPLSTHWKLFLFGQKTTGTVVKPKISSPLLYSTDRYSIIEFKTHEAKKILIYGPEDLEYPIGKEFKILYNKNKPQNYVILNAAGLLLTNKVILPIVALILWISFYLSFGQEAKRKQRTGSFISYNKSIENNKK